MKKEHKELKRLVKKANSILLLTHKGPDVDAFCSMLLAYRLLTNAYPEKAIKMKSKSHPSFKLPFTTEIELVESVEVGEEDLVIITDTPELHLSLDKEEGIETPLVLIDHHRTERSDDRVALLINEMRSSATEQVYATFKDVLGKNFRLDEEVAMFTQYGIVGDTGRFLYDGTSSDTFRIFAETKDVFSADLEEFTYKSAKFPQDATPVIIEYLKSLKVEGDMAYMYISKDVIEKNEFTKQGVNEAMAFLRDSYIRYMQGVHWGFIVRPNFDEENVWDASFRSTKGYQNVEVIAKELGGGGHLYSSGIRLEGDNVQDIVNRILEVTSRLSA